MMSLQPFHISPDMHDYDRQNTSVRRTILLVIFVAGSLYMNLSLLWDIQSVRAKLPRTVVRSPDSYSKSDPYEKDTVLTGRP